MKSDKEMFEFFNEFIFLDHSINGVNIEVDILRKYIINRFHKTIPSSRMLIVLSLIDDIILKIFSKDLEGVQNDMYDVRENILYMLSFEKVVEEEKSVEIINVIDVENMKTIPENEQVRAYKEGIVEYGNDFKNCKINHSNQ